MNEHIAKIAMIEMHIALIMMIIRLNGCTDKSTCADTTTIDNTTPTVKSVQTILGKTDSI